MIALPPQIRVFLYRQPTDMRNYAVQAFMRSQGRPPQADRLFAAF